ncbi:DUF1206 domain-containing protein [Tolypothrix sp. FACHB-123]|uniref:DUF1206 domain-containing protein n=1 Tax=Tolypothrix sp. FACHB-123 TaxID=2692868 RepID=UPI0016896415|nr:DUF1206 domain-containing protein [Tolypothrix sp. FACHB-123]MBD2355258.1 DUF1206 domain-containing protein [Tolypothrix sp. FACHB-123]
MAIHDPFPENIKQPVRQVAAYLWVERLARLGYAAKGLVYFLVGLLAAQAAFGTGGETTDTSGALEAIVTQPFGKLLLIIVTIGLIGYAFWRFVQTILDPEHSGETMSAKRIAKRLGYAFSAIAYFSLAVTSIKLIVGSSSGDSDSVEDWTIFFLNQPFGRWLVLLLGLTVIIVGIAFLYQAYTGKFRRYFKLAQMSLTEEIWAVRLGRFGIAARGIVFAIIGIFMMLAAIQLDGTQARGLGGALSALAMQPFGPWILGVVALGLIAYGMYSIIQARYRNLTKDINLR